MNKMLNVISGNMLSVTYVIQYKNADENGNYLSENKPPANQIFLKNPIKHFKSQY